MTQDARTFIEGKIKDFNATIEEANASITVLSRCLAELTAMEGMSGSFGLSDGEALLPSDAEVGLAKTVPVVSQFPTNDCIHVEIKDVLYSFPKDIDCGSLWTFIMGVLEHTRSAGVTLDQFWDILVRLEGTMGRRKTSLRAQLDKMAKDAEIVVSRTPSGRKEYLIKT